MKKKITWEITRKQKKRKKHFVGAFFRAIIELLHEQIFHTFQKKNIPN